jgi:hypothetical protein
MVAAFFNVNYLRKNLSNNLDYNVTIVLPTIPLLGGVAAEGR